MTLSPSHEAGAGSHALTPVVATVARLVNERRWVLVVWVAMTVWVVAMSAVAHGAYTEFRFARFDLGNMVQAVWNTTQGRILEVTDGSTGEQLVRLGAHVDPILVLFAPLWAIWPSPLLLAFAQIGAIALGALPVLWIARRHSASERTASLLALAYLAYPWIAWTAVDAFHPVTLAIPLLLYCVWFLDEDRLVAFGACAILVAATGELMGVVVGSLGIWYALARGRRAVGLGIAALGAAWTLVALYLIVPAFSGGPSVHYGHYADVGGSPLGVARTAATDPVAVLSAVTERDDVMYVILLAAPLASAFLLAPGLAALALPQLAVNVLASIGATTRPQEHYIAGILPFLFAALAIGVGRLSPRRRDRVAVLVLTLSVASTVVLGPWFRGSAGEPAWQQVSASAAHVRALRRAVALVPEAAPVSSTNRVGSQLAARRYLYSAPVLGRAEWIVLDLSDPWIPDVAAGQPDHAALERFRLDIELSRSWRKVFEDGDVLVFRRAVS